MANFDVLQLINTTPISINMLNNWNYFERLCEAQKKISFFT